MATSLPASVDLPSTANDLTIPTQTAPPVTNIPPTTLARWGPRWTPTDLLSSISQYSLESGWVEGTVHQWAITQTTEDDIVFHSALDAMAATLHRSKTLFIHSPVFSSSDSLRVAHEVQNVEESMGLLLEQFRKIRPLETETQAFNVGVGMEEHYKLFQRFEQAVREKVVGEGKAKVEESFLALERDFEETIVVFKGEQKVGEQEADGVDKKAD